MRQTNLKRSKQSRTQFRSGEVARRAVHRTEFGRLEVANAVLVVEAEAGVLLDAHEVAGDVVGHVPLGAVGTPAGVGVRGQAGVIRRRSSHCERERDRSLQ